MKYYVNKNEKVEEQKAEIVKTEEVKKEEKIESKIEKQEEIGSSFD